MSIQLPSKFKYIIFILFLGVQMYFALSYYMGKYPWDERFAWRMFSTVRSLQCKPQAWIQNHQAKQACPHHSQHKCNAVRFTQDVHMIWYNLMKRGRKEVIQSWVKRICARPQTEALYFSLQCPHPEKPHPMQDIISPIDDACRALHIKDLNQDSIKNK